MQSDELALARLGEAAAEFSRLLIEYARQATPAELGEALRQVNAGAAWLQVRVDVRADELRAMLVALDGAGELVAIVGSMTAESDAVGGLQ